MRRRFRGNPRLSSPLQAVRTLPSPSLPCVKGGVSEADGGIVRGSRLRYRQCLRGVARIATAVCGLPRNDSSRGQGRLTIPHRLRRSSLYTREPGRGTDCHTVRARTVRNDRSQEVPRTGGAYGGWDGLPRKLRSSQWRVTGMPRPAPLKIFLSPSPRYVVIDLGQTDNIYCFESKNPCCV